MYPFYLFLICINGNSVGLNLCDGSRLWSSRNPIFLLVNRCARSTAAFPSPHVVRSPGTGRTLCCFPSHPTHSSSTCNESSALTDDAVHLPYPFPNHLCCEHLGYLVAESTAMSLRVTLKYIFLLLLNTCRQIIWAAVC